MTGRIFQLIAVIIGIFILTVSSFDEIPQQYPSVSLQSHLFHGFHVSNSNTRNTNSSLEDKVDIRHNYSGKGHFKYYPVTANEDDVGLDRDGRRNHFLMHHHRARKRTKPNMKEKPFAWYPSVPPFLTRPTDKTDDLYVPFFPFTMSSWLRKPNDILLVVLQEEKSDKASAVTTTNTSTPCTCSSSAMSRFSQASNDNDLGNDRNKSASDSLITQWPSSCIWAIVACCAPNNYHLRFGCFNFLSCTVPFWEIEVCQISIILSAAEETLKYYQQFTEKKKTTPASDESSTTSLPNSDSKVTSTTSTTPMTTTKATSTTTTTTTTTAATTTSTASTSTTSN